MAYLGIILLYLACGSTILAIITGLLAIREKNGSKGALTARWSTLSTLAISLATLGLIVAFLSNDFAVAYVARHSARNLPLIYKVSALWAGQSGSLLLWLLVISLLTLGVQRDKESHRVGLGIVIDLVRLFFLLLLLFVTPPFELLADPPYDGSGLNPMLQSLGMVIHPPLLFVGFSGFLVPFALALTGLITRDDQAVWQERAVPWIRLSWLFLTAGIVTGGHWAYTELGWGGYWAWDPVENASLFPWLTSTALLHLAILPKEYRFKRIWSYGLIVLTYLLTIFATFLTRSGVLDSVHAFAGGVLGQIFLLVLVLLFVFCLALGWSRRKLLRLTDTQAGQGLSAAGTNILISSVLLLMLCAGVLFGTMFPLISRFFGAREVVLDASFFNQLSVPLFLAILFFMSAAPVLQDPMSIVCLLKRLWLPVLLASGVGAATANGAFALAAFGFGTHLPGLLVPSSTREWGAVLAHLGVLIMLVGITGSSLYVDDVFVSVEPGDTVVFGDYVLDYDGLSARYGSDRYTIGTTLAISKDSRERGTLRSEKTFWQGRNQPSTQVGIFRTLKEDIYLNLVGWENPAAQLHLQRFALVGWIWMGSWIVYLGMLVILCAQARQVRLWPKKTG